MLSTISTVLLCTKLLTQIFFLLKGKKEEVTTWVLGIVSILLMSDLVLRSIEIEFPALTNTFEALLFFAGAITLTLFILKKKGSMSYVLQFGGAAMALILLLIASSPAISSEVRPPIPALQSNWLLLHVSFAFIGQAFFVVSFVGAILYMTTKKKRDFYERITVNSIIIGYPIYTAGAIIFGAIWASSAWGAFWSWDPKEIWALITWFIYTIYLHGRYTKYIKGRRLAWISIIGFAVSLFTFFGVNYLMPGFHSYG